MGIISVSLDEAAMREMDALQKSLGISGRSELVRTAMKSLASEMKERAALVGRVECVLLVVHSHSATGEIAQIRHKYEELIRTQMHSHVSGEKCLEILVAGGEGGKIRKLAGEFSRCKKVDYVRLVQS